MNKNVNYNSFENIIIDMKRHVSSLHEKLSISGRAVSRIQNINEKILAMKEVLFYFCLKNIIYGFFIFLFLTFFF